MGLGGVGAKIIKEMYEVNVRPPPAILEQLGIQPIKHKNKIAPNVEVQIIDMAYMDEEKKIYDKLINNYDFVFGDHIRILMLPEHEYRADTILGNSIVYGYKPIRRYWKIADNVIRNLGPRKGVKRYRPLARYFVTNVIDTINQTIRDDIIHDFNRKPPDVALFIASSGGGFGSGSFSTIASLIKEEYDSTTALFLHLPLFTRYSLPSEDAPFGHSDALASVGITLLELMYLYELSQDGKSYEDGLTKNAAQILNLSSGFRLRPIDYIVLSGMTGISKMHPAIASIKEEFDKHDEVFARIILATISGFVKRGGQLIQILQDNPKIHTYKAQVVDQLKIKRKKESNSEQQGQEKGLVSIAMPVDVYSAGYIELPKKKVREVARNVQELSRQRCETENRIKDIEEKLDKLASELNRLAMRKGEYNKELERLRKISTETDIEELVASMPNAKQILEGLNDLENNSAKFKLISEIIINAISGIHGVIIADKKGVAQALDLLSSKDFGEKIGQLQTYAINVINQARNIISIIAPDLTSSYNAGQKTAIQEACTKKRLLDEISSYINKVKETINTLSDSLGKIETVAMKYRGKVLCGKPCKLSKIIKRLGDSFSGILSESTNIISWINTVLRDLDEYIKGYERNLLENINAIDANIKDIKNKVNEAEKEKELLEERLKNLNHELSSNIAIFIHNYVKMFETIGAVSLENVNIQGLVKNVLLSSNIQEKIMEIIENNLESISSIKGAIDLVSQLSNVAASQLWNSIADSVIQRADAQTLTIDRVIYFAKKFGLSEDITSYSSVAEYYVLYTDDNRELAKQLIERLQGKAKSVQQSELTSEAYSFIAVIKKQMNVPIIAIKEAREAIKKALEKITIFVCKDSEKGLNCDNVVEEFRGLRFTTLDPESPEFLEFLEGVKKSIESYESYIPRQ